MNDLKNVVTNFKVLNWISCKLVQLFRILIFEIQAITNSSVLFGIQFFMIIILISSCIELKSYRIPTVSMENEILRGSHVLSTIGKFKPKRFDIVVYRFPEGDTVTLPNYPMSYYALIRNTGDGFLDKEIKKIYVPLDKRELWVGRCIAIPGDEVFISEAKLFVNAKLYENPNVKKTHVIHLKMDIPVDSSVFYRMGIDENDLNFLDDSILAGLTAKQVQELVSINFVNSVIPYIYSIPDSITYFPFSSNYLWTQDSFGPLKMPAKNKAILLNLLNLPIYSRLISVYENNTLKIEGNKIYINGIECSSYTPKMNYYFIVCDNRDNSNDSRYWGFMPENHLVGKVVKVVQ